MKEPIRILPWLIWTIGTTLIVYLWPSLLLDGAPWDSNRAEKIGCLAMAAVNAAACLCTALFHRNKRPESYFVTLAITVAGLGLFATYLFATGLPFRKVIMVGNFALVVFFQILGLFLIYRAPSKLRQVIHLTAVVFGSLALILVALNPGHFLQKFRDIRIDLIAKATGKSASDLQNKSVSTLRTAYYPIQLTDHRNLIEASEVNGGGWAVYSPTELLLCTGDGRFFKLSDLEENQSLKVQQMNLRVPFNRSAYSAEAKSKALIHDEWFRVAGVHLREDGEQQELYVTYHHWSTEDQAVYVRFAVARGSKQAFFSETPPEWEILWESSPGIKVHMVPKEGRLAFAGLQIGGRIQDLDSETLIFTVGDHEFDGVNADEIYPQDPDATYGKAYTFDLKTKEVSLFSSGLRNPQGLYVEDDGKIWETEHGPQGGDEINLLVKGENYGWPLVTIGVDYGTYQWPLTELRGDHSGYKLPVYAWAKSVGASNIFRLKKGRFPAWQDHLIMGSLGAQSVFRVKTNDDRVVSIERIQTGLRARDIIEAPNGRIFIWADGDRIATMDQTAEKVIQYPEAFGQCIICHSFYPDEAHKTGPNLFEVFDRDIASAEGFNYSPKLTSIPGKWTEEQLDAFLANPMGFAPGTMMAVPGIQDSETRGEILNFLKDLK